MKTMTDLIQNTVRMGFHDVVMAATNSPFIYGSYAAGEYLYRKAYMYRNTLDQLELVQSENHSRHCTIKFTERSIRYWYNADVATELYIRGDTSMSEEEFFQFSLVNDTLGMDYKLYMKTIMFYRTILVPIFGF